LLLLVEDDDLDVPNAVHVMDLAGVGLLQDHHGEIEGLVAVLEKEHGLLGGEAASGGNRHDDLTRRAACGQLDNLDVFQAFTLDQYLDTHDASPFGCSDSGSTSDPPEHHT